MLIVASSVGLFIVTLLIMFYGIIQTRYLKRLNELIAARQITLSDLQAEVANLAIERARKLKAPEMPATKKLLCDMTVRENSNVYRTFDVLIVEAENAPEGTLILEHVVTKQNAQVETHVAWSGNSAISLEMYRNSHSPKAMWAQKFRIKLYVMTKHACDDQA